MNPLLLVVIGIQLQVAEAQRTKKNVEENKLAIEQQGKVLLEQTKIFQASARLSAIGHIYEHYQPSYGATDATGVLAAVAAGHRRWAIRESFSVIDPELDGKREEQVSQDYEKLVSLLKDRPSPIGIKEVARILGSILLDRRLPAEKRIPLWGLYEAVRDDAVKTRDAQEIISPTFLNARSEFLAEIGVKPN